MSSLTSTNRLRATYNPSDCQARILAFMATRPKAVELCEIRSIDCLPLAAVEEVLDALDCLEHDGRIRHREEPRTWPGGIQRMVTVYFLTPGAAGGGA